MHQPKSMIPNPGGRGLVQTNAATVAGYLSKLCAAGGVTVDSETGEVMLSKGFCMAPVLPKGSFGPPTPRPAQLSATPTGCGCLCDLNGIHQ